MSGGGICLVKASKNSGFKEGDVVSGFVEWSTHYVADEASLVSIGVLCKHVPHAVTAVLPGAVDFSVALHAHVWMFHRLCTGHQPALSAAPVGRRQVAVALAPAHVCWCCLQGSMTKIDPALLGKVPLSYFLGTLGMPGTTRPAASSYLLQAHDTSHTCWAVLLAITWLAGSCSCLCIFLLDCASLGRHKWYASDFWHCMQECAQKIVMSGTPWLFEAVCCASNDVVLTCFMRHVAGMTAYASLKKIAEPKAGEVAFVSGAAGAVGLVAGQLLKHVYGCKVIGSAGTDDKVSRGYHASRCQAAIAWYTHAVSEAISRCTRNV
jgi:NADPH-dependent curcumin reductase CurA